MILLLEVCCEAILHSFPPLDTSDIRAQLDGMDQEATAMAFWPRLAVLSFITTGNVTFFFFMFSGN